jgi:hypothetical protein
MRILSVILTLALFGVCSTAMAQWQWLDKDGRKVFSDRAPPPDVMDKDIVKRPAGQVRAGKDTLPKDNAATAAADGAATPATAAPGGVDKELEAKKKQAADAEAAKKKAEEDRLTKARIENCARAKQAMASFDAGQRISRTNAAGEREVLDDASRDVERARIQTIMNSECR